MATPALITKPNTVLNPVYQNDISFSIDKNFTKHSYKFYTNYGADSHLIIGIVCYIQKNISHFNQINSKDLFGEYEFDYKDFMKFFNVSKAWLFEKHPSPYYLKIKEEGSNRGNETIVSESFFMNNLGNALLLLYSKPFNEFYMQRNTKDKTSERLGEKYLFFKSLNVDIIKGGNANKYRISFALNDNVELNIFRLFDRVNTGIICNSKLRKNNLDTFYLYLLNAKNIALNTRENKFYVFPDNNSAQSAFDFLSTIMQVEKIKDFIPRKKKMFAKMKIINSITGDNVSLCFDSSSTGKSANKPYFVWENFDPYNDLENEKLYSDAFEERYFFNLKKDWRTFHLLPTNVETKYSFDEWRRSPAVGIKIKVDAYVRTAAEMWGKKLEYDSTEVVMMFGSPEQKKILNDRKTYGANYKPEAKLNVLSDPTGK